MIPATIPKPIGLDLVRKAKVKELPSGKLSFNDFLSAFSYSEAMEIGYVPTILYEYAYIYAYRDMCNEMRLHRLSEFKRHSREIGRIVSESRGALLAESSRKALGLLDDTVERFRNRYIPDRANLIGELAARMLGTHPQCPYPDLYVYAHAARLYIERGHHMQRHYDRLCGRRTGTPAAASLNPWATLVLAVLTDICDRYPIDTSGEVKRLMGIVTYRIKQFTHTLR